MKTVLIIALLLISTSSMANGFFVSLDVGRASTDVPEVTIPDDIANNITRTVDDSDTGWQVQLGYRFEQSWSAAISYVDLGNGEQVFEGDTLTPEIFAQLASSSPVLVNGFTASAIYHVYEQDDIFLNVEAGLFRWNTNLDNLSVVSNVRDDDSGTDIMWGATVGYKITPHWHVYAGYQSYELEERIDLPHLGVTYQF